MKSRNILTALALAILPLTGIEAQTLRGEVVEAMSGEPIPFATVTLTGSIKKSCITDSVGKFRFDNLPIERYSVKASYIGYVPAVSTDLLVSSAKETVVRLPMQEDNAEMGEVVVRPKVAKEQPLNQMMIVGGKMLSVEETSRYAGGFDDPARFVNSFAGISSTGAENGISVHGNAPHMVQWHIEGVEVPAPSHMADCYTLGSGLISSLSALVMGNSDFAYSAFPAEYGNAIGGLLDIKLRNGNNTRYEHSVGAGLLGVEASSEGPLNKKTGASYLVNYRYSLLGLANSMGVITSGDVLNYTDLNFKINLPTKRMGTFGIFGIGWIDHAYVKLEEPSAWESIYDQENTDVKQRTGIFGLTHRYMFNRNTSLNTTLSTSLQHSDIFDEYAILENQSDLASQQHRVPYAKAEKRLFDITFNTYLQQRFGGNVVLKQGINLIRHDYKLDMNKAPSILITNTNASMLPVYSAEYDMLLAEYYASANIKLGRSLLLNTGIFALWNTDNGKAAIDPRFSLRWEMGNLGSLSFGYGLHSMLERMDALAVTVDGELVNKNLGFTRSHQFMLSWAKKLGDSHNLKVDLFYQRHFNVAVGTGENAAFSMLNQFDYYVDAQLVNKGKGRNYGIDMTFERYFNQGFYYMLNASLFKSEYAGIDGKWHNTRFDRGYVFKVLGGKEWIMGRRHNKVLTTSLKIAYLGGLRHSPYDVAASKNNPDYEVEYDETEPFSKQLSPDVNIDLTVSYKINQSRTSHEIGLKWLNVLNNGNYTGDVYNYKKDKIEPYKVEYTFPNLYYRLYF